MTYIHNSAKIFYKEEKAPEEKKAIWYSFEGLNQNWQKLPEKFRDFIFGILILIPTYTWMTWLGPKVAGITVFKGTSLVKTITLSGVTTYEPTVLLYIITDILCPLGGYAIYKLFFPTLKTNGAMRGFGTIFIIAVFIHIVWICFTPAAPIAKRALVKNKTNVIFSRPVTIENQNQEGYIKVFDWKDIYPITSAGDRLVIMSMETGKDKYLGPEIKWWKGKWYKKGERWGVTRHGYAEWPIMHSLNNGGFYITLPDYPRNLIVIVKIIKA